MIDFISKYNNYDEIKLAELRYGLVSIYLLITKFIVIIILSIILGILKEMIIFTLIYIPIRAVSFGLHASKSWICLLFSSLVFIGSPMISNYIIVPTTLQIVLSVICVTLMYKNSPADTHKKPIVSPKRRLFFKYCSVLITVLYSFILISISIGYPPSYLYLIQY